MLRALGTLLVLHCLLAGSPTATAAPADAPPEARYRSWLAPDDLANGARHAQEQLAALPAPIAITARKPIYIALGLQQRGLWIETPIPPGTERIVISGRWIETFDAYLVEEGTLTDRYSAGSRRPAFERPILSPRFVIPIDASRSAQSLIIHHPPQASAAVYPIQFMTRTEYARSAQLMHLGHGIFFGLMLIAVAFSLGTWLTTQNAEYLFLGGYGFGIAGTLASINGFLDAYLLPGHPELALTTAAILSSMTLLCSLTFTRLLLRGPNTAGWLDKITQGLAVTSLAVGLLSLSQFYQAVFVLLATLAIGSLIITLAYGIAAHRRQPDVSRFYLIARLPPALAAVSLPIGSLGGWGGNLATELFPIAICFEFLVLSVVLSRRLGREQSARLTAVARARKLGRQLGQLRQITEESKQLRRVQRNVQDAHRLRTISQMTSGIAHDFNNIFTTVMGFAELLKLERSGADPAERQGHAEQIHQAGQRGSDLVQQLLIYSRSTKPALKLGDLTELVRTDVSLVQRLLEPSQQLEVVLPKEPLEALIDPQQFSQVLVNLVSNASEASAGDGTIELSLERQAHASATCSSCFNHFEGDRLVLSIRDRGTGLKVPPQELFTPFHTTKAIGEGSGLGLSVVDGIVHEHGGHLALNNRPHGGTEVSVYLPRHSGGDPGTAATATLLHLRSKQRSAAAEPVAKLARYYSVLSTDRRSEALRRYLESPSQFALLVLEIDREDDGWLELAGDIRRADPTVPILLIASGDNDAAAIDAAATLPQTGRTRVLDAHSEVDSILQITEQLLRSEEDRGHDIQSLRAALHRAQRQDRAHQEP